MKYLFIVLVLSGLTGIANAATLTISNVSGTVATGQILTITGSNMVQEDTTNWLTRFKTGTAYGFEGSSWTADGYNDAGTTNGPYDSTVKIQGSHSVKYQSTASVGAAQTGNAGFFAFSGAPTDYWVRAYERYHANNNTWPKGHMKMLGISATGGMQYFQFNCNADGSAPTSTLAVAGNAASSGINAFPAGLMNDRWYLVEMHVTPTSISAWIDGVQQVSNYTFTPSATSHDYFNLGIINMSDANGPFDHAVDITNWVDALTISTSRIYGSSTVEISNSPTYHSGTWLYQEPQYLSDGTVQIKADLTGLGSGPYYLWVTNNGQVTSAAYNLSTGVGSGDTVLPIVTAFVLPSTASSLTVPINSFAVADEKALASSPYCVTTTNSSSGCSWTSTVPSTVTFTSSGTKIAYAWAKDAVGNISTAVTANVTITAPVNGACGSSNGQSFSSLTAVSANLCSTGTVASFSGTGPWTWGCNGSNGGNNTASDACSASLTSTSDTTLFTESFENNSYSSRGWYDNTNHGTIVSGGQSGNCLQWSWASGATKPTNGGSMRMEFTPTDSLYLSYYVKFQSGWRGSQQTYHPHMLNILSDLDDAANAYSPLANNYLNAYVEFQSDVGSPYTIRPQLALQDELRVNTSNGTPPNDLTAKTENRSVNYCNTPVTAGVTGTCYADTTYYSANIWKAPTATISTNAWHKVEVYFKMNSISSGKGLSDGIMQEKIDGNLVIDRKDVLYRTNQDATKKWAQFVLTPYIGDGSPIAQTMWLDELTLVTALPDTWGKPAPAGVLLKSVSPN